MAYQIINIILGSVAKMFDKVYVVIQREREPSRRSLILFASQLQQYQTLESKLFIKTLSGIQWRFPSPKKWHLTKQVINLKPCLREQQGEDPQT